MKLVEQQPCFCCAVQWREQRRRRQTGRSTTAAACRQRRHHLLGERPRRCIPLLSIAWCVFFILSKSETARAASSSARWTAAATDRYDKMPPPPPPPPHRPPTPATSGGDNAAPPNDDSNDDAEFTEHGFRRWHVDDGNDARYRDADDMRRRAPRRPPPPIPQSQPIEGAAPPIHYVFPDAQHRRRQDPGHDAVDESNDEYVPRTFSTHDEYGPPVRTNDDEDDRQTTMAFASPRHRDVIARYTSRADLRVLLMTSSGLVGYSVGYSFARSFLSWCIAPHTAGQLLGIVLALLVLWRNNVYGELSKALGMAVLLSGQRFVRLRRRYRTGPHVQASLGWQPRRLFPPTSNPWQYESGRYQDERVYFNMLYSVAAMGLVGSTVGGNLSVPLLPTWLGAMVGAMVLAYGTTLNSARGDLCRMLGARVVALVHETSHINRELRLLSKLGAVSSNVLDKALILDRQHRIKDRIVAAVSFLVEKGTRAANRVQADMRGSDDDDGPDDRFRNDSRRTPFRGRPPPPPRPTRPAWDTDRNWVEDKSDDYSRPRPPPPPPPSRPRPQPELEKSSSPFWPFSRRRAKTSAPEPEPVEYN